MAFCCQKLERHEEAIQFYGMCIGQQPDFAEINPIDEQALGVMDTTQSDAQ